MSNKLPVFVQYLYKKTDLNRRVDFDSREKPGILTVLINPHDFPDCPGGGYTI